MVQVVIRFDAISGKLAELDKFLTEHFSECVKFFDARSVCLYEDALVGYPERELRIEFEDLGKAQNLVSHEEWRRDREILLGLATDVSSQIVTPRLCV